MPTLESYRKQAKLLVRWHAERNHSVGGKVRQLERLRHLTDIQILDQPMPLVLAQEVVAVEAGFADWAALKRSVEALPARSKAGEGAPRLVGVTPVLHVRDVPAAAAFYADRLGFSVDFLHGAPAFYGAVSRDGVSLHLRHVAAPNFAELAAREPFLILATIEVANVKALFAEVEARGAPVAHPLTRQPWGGLDFYVRDPDGNMVSFVQYATGA